MCATIDPALPPEFDDALAAEKSQLAAEIFRMLADATRVRLLWLLGTHEELAVSELAAAVGKPGPAVSQHLAKLRLAQLVQTRRDGTQIFYRLSNEHVAGLIRDAVYNAEHFLEELPRHHAKGQER